MPEQSTPSESKWDPTDIFMLIAVGGGFILPILIATLGILLGI